ncbi:hypothetical protein NUU61_007742 [Penicillium alfredii]|uniref:Ribosomal protein S11 n=1 Tax=Penicillium alfredii TaxID=1506179 RepID=A0A9W9ERA7_9EURO|nr:uncharacterized protein NUU61_007742 [Penicillium alfredii]KAJ5086435.1 hypothetical protein NUU61_007742 [Penicillium alfredii]
MTSFSINALFKTLPPVGRQCHPRISSCTIRPFSSSPRASLNQRDKPRDIERQILDREPESSAESSSPLSAITKMMQGDNPASSSSQASNYSRMAESLEADVVKDPYSDRSPPHHLHVYCHKHNTVITLTRPNGEPMMTASCGQIGFRHAGRGGFDPAYQLTSHVISQITERGYILDIKRLEIVYRGFSKGRDGFNKVLLGNEGRNIRGLITRVCDATRVKFGGTRSRHVRRL